MKGFLSRNLAAQKVGGNVAKSIDLLDKDTNTSNFVRLKSVGQKFVIQGY